MKQSRMLLMLAVMSVGFAVLSGCAGWQEPDGGNSSSYPPSSHGGGGGHHH